MNSNPKHSSTPHTTLGEQNKPMEQQRRRQPLLPSPCVTGVQPCDCCWSGCGGSERAMHRCLGHQSLVKGTEYPPQRDARYFRWSSNVMPAVPFATRLPCRPWILLVPFAVCCLCCRVAYQCWKGGASNGRIVNVCAGVQLEPPKQVATHALFF